MPIHLGVIVCIYGSNSMIILFNITGPRRADCGGYLCRCFPGQSSQQKGKVYVREQY